MSIEKNTHFFNEALSRISIGTTSEEFAKNYANASGEAGNSSIWNNYFENGKEIFETLEQEKDGVIDEKEFKLLEWFINGLKNNFKGASHTDTVEKFLKTGEPDNSGIEYSRIANEISEQPPSSNIEEENTDVSEKETSKENPQEGAYTPKPGIPENTHLKTIDSMSNEEVLAEIKQYMPEFDKAQYSEKMMRHVLSDIRQQNLMVDENSNIVDFHIGTFKQHSIGSCTLLSQLINMSDEKMQKIINKKQDEKGTYYEVTFPMDYGQEGKSVTVCEEELKDGIVIKHEGKQYKINAENFSQGDDTVRLVEMAFVKKFGYNISDTGVNLNNIQKVFTFPDETQAGGIHNVTEELLTKSNHSSISLIAMSDGTMPEDFSYAEEFRSETGAVASWSISKGERAMAMMSLKNIGVNTDGFEKLSNAEFLDRIAPYLSSDFGFIATLQINGKDVMIESHAYALSTYNPDTKTVTLVNPYASNEDIYIPLDVAEKFLAISV